MRPSTIKFVFIIVLLSPDCITAQWKTFLEVDAPEGQPEGFIVYNKFPQPTAGEVYVLFYAQKGDSLDKVGLFKVSPSGIVTTAQKLIYEKGKANKYDLTIVKRPRDAKNGGLATTIRVKVQDVNNFPPLFTFALYNGTIREDSPSDTVVMGLENCHAEERDTSGIRAYRIVKGNEKGYLKAGKREVAGKSFLQLKATEKPIQRSKTGAYMTLIVEAEDMGNPPLTGRTSVRVWIEEVNNYAPAFDKKSYERTISEDTPKMMSLLRVQATDKDDGVSGQVYYFFQTLSSFFTINPFTGIITLVRELDYSQSDQRLHQLSIVARDAGNPAKESSATVTISVDKDVPNFPFSALSSSSQENTAPFFPKAAYHFTFQASFPVKGSLGAVVAVDMDPPGPNSDLRYSLVSVSDKFSVDTFSGVLTVSKTVNVGTYTMMVRAQDQGNPSKQAQAQIKVEVEDFDYSHNYPVFSNPIQEINVNENTAIGTSVFQAAVVSDSSISKGVVYSAISGSALPYFEVDEETGVMKTASPLDRERHGVYDMLIEARNKEKLPRHSYLYVIIEITNKDDAYPDFTKAAYDASVPEGSPKETFVTVIHAIDKDDPVITYSIPSSPSPFEIESRTGVIRTKRVLDRAMGDNEFMVYVVANDGGGKSSETIVRVNVTSAHNSAPKFQKDSYDVSLKEGQGLVPNLLCIAATGSDGVVKYAMKKGGDHRFQVDQDTGRFSVMDSFNYMSERGFVVQVEARSESSSQVALASVSVNIKNDDGPPAFLTKSYDITTLENVAVGTKLLVDDNGGFRFSTDGKPSTDFDCTLEDITKVQIIDHFKVERANSECQLQVIKTFVETLTREFKFDVRVTNVKQRNLFATAAVTVKITDTNDFPPEFVQSSYWVTVPTTTPSGTSLLQVIALDRDNEGNPDIVLDLLSEGAQDDLSRFQLDSQGVLRTTSSNLPANTLYNLKVKARETGTDQPKESEVSLKISVLNVPFVPLAFEAASYSKILSEDASVSTSVFTVKASRSGSDIGIQYSIVGGNMDNTFTINSNSGQITLAKKLDYETTKLHKLIIRATLPSSDSSPDVTAEITGEVKVADANDNKPRFLLYEQLTHLAIESYTPSGTRVFQARATDVDTEETSGAITYTIYEAASSPSSNIPFSLDRNTGELKTSKEIKFTDRSSYMLLIRATDDGGQKSHASIQITVLDTSKPPSFKQDEYTRIISEDSPVGTSVIDIKADYDDSSALLKYYVVRGNENQIFCIDYLGVISVAQPLDRETVSSYELTVMVSRNNKNDTTIVKVTISDVNDYPVFKKSLYIIDVAEDKAVNSNLKLLTATDRDSGDNGRLIYSILQTVMDESKDVFAIDSTSGMVTLKKHLDREKVSEHVIYIRVRDSGISQLQLADITKLVIRVTDVNDNVPRFSTTSYQVSIPATAKKGDQVIQTSATDLDSGVNALIYFNITEGNEDEVFTIDNSNGLVFLGKTSIASLAKEDFTLTIEAYDEKDASKKDIATVLVNVFPVDGPPLYPEASLNFSVKEGLPAGNKIVSLAAATTEYVMYKIVSGNEDGVLEIDPFSGDLFTAQELDSETSLQYKLHVRATDIKERSADVNVTINVLDIDDNIPFFIDSIGGQVDRKVEAGFQKGDEVTQIEAYDLDEESFMEYKLSAEAEAFFSIDNGGHLIAKKAFIDSVPGKRAIEPLSTIAFNVEAADNAKPPNKVTTPVRLAFANYKSGHDPVAVTVPENARVGKILTEIPKYIPGGTFSILSPESSPFTVDENGIVKLSRRLDFETQAKYLLTVRETGWVEGVTTSNDIDLEVSVKDVNDNDPRFEMQMKHARLNGNSRAGTGAYKLRVFDADSGQNGLAGYQLLSTDVPFGINPMDDAVEVGRDLTKNQYDLELRSYDYGIPRRQNAPIKVRLDVGQLPPRFLGFYDDGYRFEVAEDAKGGTVIGRITAVSVSGSRVGYTILEGNDDNKFKITNSGEIKLNFLLDYETQKREYNLVVQAVELIPLGLKSTIKAKIFVLNANDYYPLFEKGSYMTTVEEDVALGTPMLTVSATDCDCVQDDCRCAPGQLVYSVINTDYFTIDPDTGVISSSRILDYESQVTHIFKVEVSDTLRNVTKFDVALVNVTLTNTNDNAPHFEYPEYRLDIDEEAAVGKGIGMVVAQDPDHQPLSYSITAGSGPFVVDSNTGIISLRQSLPSQPWEYTLTIRASDSESYSDTKVVIAVKDKNNNRPVFEKCENASVTENLPVGQVVTTVLATDKDRGKNGEVEYSIAHGDEHFEIDNTTGVLRTRVSFDRETKRQYAIVIKAEDGGHGSSVNLRLLRYCRMIVAIDDVNDNYPFFRSRRYEGSVWQNAAKGTSIMRVHAFDADSEVNSKVEYRFTEANDKFAISTDGLISTKVSLTSVLGTFTDHVLASNTEPMTVGGTETDQRLRETEVTIYVTALRPPEFTKQVFRGSIAENSKPDTFIVQIEARSLNNQQLRYVPLWTWTEASEYFHIDPNTGEITSGGISFDYEIGDVFKMQFRARESDELFSTCLVEVEVQDLNDNSPKFSLESYSGRVPENVPRGTPVIRVHASDEDSGLGAEVTYAIEAIDGVNHHRYFTIDTNSGVISTEETFDRENAEQQTFLLVVKATDKGNPPLSSRTYVTIIVVDDNDMEPTFKSGDYSLTVNEDVPVGEVIHIFTAEDGDVGYNTIVNFFISSGNVGQAFDVVNKVSPNRGELVVENSLDYERTREYSLVVIATDGRSASQSKTVSIQVLDVNDHAPVFHKLRYHESVEEGTPSNEFVLSVSVFDIDTTNDEITYFLDREGQRYFTIGSRTGEIKTAQRPLDREKTPVLNFTVFASDGKNTGEAGVKITVTDVNDKAPYFPNPPYIGTLEENAPPGTSVTVVQAVDEDDPSKQSGNTQIKYSLNDDSDGRFAVDETTALITALTTFDREKEDDIYYITIRATDQGTPQLSGTTTVTIEIHDSNDHRPQFYPKEYTASVPENAFPGFYVTAVNATDDDIGFNAALEFTIVSGNVPYAFYINPLTGQVSVSSELDFESNPRYTLKINVSDLGIPQQTSNELATLHIKILDANDHPPVFSPDDYSISIFENTTIETSLLTLITIDEDTDIATSLSFEILSGDWADIFDVKPDPSNIRLGILYTTARLDRESADSYTLEIIVKDEDGLFDTCSVTITVLDVNDNGPHFVPSFFVGSILENIADPQFVVTLNAYDPDEPSNGSPFSYRILNGTVNDNFIIRPSTADIFSNGIFRYEEKREWKLWVEVTDSGKPVMSNITTVYIWIRDSINNNLPFNASMTIILNAYQGKFAGGEIGKVYYQDDDFEVDENEYKIFSQNPASYFTVDPKSGNLSAQKDIPEGNYGFFVQVKEKPRNAGKPKVVFSAVNVIVQSISVEAVRMSTTIQFVDIHRAAILVGDYYSLLSTSLPKFFAVNLGGVTTSSDVLIFSIQRDLVNTQAINAQIAVRNMYASGFMTSTEVMSKLAENRDSLQNIGLMVGAFGIDNCAKEDNKTGICKNVVKAGYPFTVISGDYGQYPAPAASLTFVSINLELLVTYDSVLKSSGKTCADEPCMNEGICFDVQPEGFICKCKHKSNGLVTGPLCQETTRTFEGGLGTSYIWLPTLVAYERSVVQIEFTTTVADGLLLYQGPLINVRPGDSRDFMVIVLYGGFIRVVISLGAKPLILTMSRGPRLDDGDWHIVEVHQELKVFTVIIDRCKNARLIQLGDNLVEDESQCKITGKVRGDKYYLNSLWPLQVGGVENPGISYPKLNYTGFDGCIRKVINNQHFYDLKTPLKVVNSPDGCRAARSCPYCNNHGYCEQSLAKRSVCVCDVGYSGADCSKTSVGNHYLENSYSQYSVTAWSSSSSSSASSSRQRREVASPQSITSEYFTNIALKMKAKPGTNDSLIFLSTNSLGTEFVRVDLHDGKIRCIFRLAGRTKILRLQGVNVTDDKYHTIIVERLGNYATLQVDYAGKVEGSTGGSNHLMNHGGGALFAGGIRRKTALKVMQAIVKSHGKAIVQTASGSLISTYSSFSGSSLSGVSLITINDKGDVRVKKLKNATLIRMYQKHTIRSIHNASSQRVVIGSAGVSVTQVRVGNNSLQSVQQILQRRHQQDVGAGVSGAASAANGGKVALTSGNAQVSGSKIKGVGNYGSVLALKQTESGQTATREDVDESYGGCIPQNRLNNFDLDDRSTTQVKVERQNVIFGCPCEKGECANDGTCTATNLTTPLVNYTTPWMACKCVGQWTGPLCQEYEEDEQGFAPPVRITDGSSWIWDAVLAFLLFLLILLILLGIYLLCARCKGDAVDGTVPTKAPAGHGTIRSYADVGAGEEDNNDYDLRQLMTYMYTGRIYETMDLDHSHEYASIRIYSDGGVQGTDNNEYDLKHLMSHTNHVTTEKVLEKPLGTNNQAFHSSTAAVSSNLHSMIVNHVTRADSHPSLSNDEVRSFQDEGLDSDVDDLSQLDSGEEGDSDNADDWDSHFISLGQV